LSDPRDLFDEFEARADARRLRGIHHYRDGDATRPFDGDPIDEAVEETLDLRNYAIEALDQGMIDDRESAELRGLAICAYRVLRFAQRRRDVVIRTDWTESG